MHERHAKQRRPAPVFPGRGSDLIPGIPEILGTLPSLRRAKHAHCAHHPQQRHRPAHDERQHQQLGDRGQEDPAFRPAECGGAQTVQGGEKSDATEKAGQRDLHHRPALPRRPGLVEIGAQRQDKLDDAADRGHRRDDAGELGQHAAVRRRRAEPGRLRRRPELRQGREHAERKDIAGRAPHERTFHEGQHLFLQDLPTARQSLLHRVLRQVKRVGHVFHRAVLAVVQDQRLPVQLGHALQRAPQDRLLLLFHRDIRHGRLGRHQFAGVLDRFRPPHRLPAFGPAQTPDLVPQDPTQPRAQLFRLTQRSQLAPGLDKRLLREVLALAQLAGRGIRQRTQQPLVPLHDPAERRALAGQAGRHQLRVAGYFDGRHVFRGVHDALPVRARKA